ncbi:MAG: hypothetical protein GX087_00915 [Desulfobulbaceae bacterium]|nr:hypothetical protein [Desulfobulbaceae bacterium]
MNWSRFFRTIGHILLGLGVSGTLLALLMHTALGGEAGQVFPKLFALIRSVSLPFIAIYLGAAIVRTVLQTRRYQVILRSSGAVVPGFLHLFLITTSRNMFIDMLPSRLGELSYVVMLRQGHKVPTSAGLSSLALAFLFDLVALAVMIALLVAYQLLFVQVQWWLLGTVITVTLVALVGFGLLFPGLTEFTRLSRQVISGWKWGFSRRVAEKLFAFLDEFNLALRHARQAGIAGQLLLYSMGVRIAKYLALYSLFYAIAVPNFPEVQTEITSTLMALISAEAGASLPLPTFMGFGSYEAGGMLTMVALGASREASLLIMLALHLLSQMMDYLLGGTALLAFMVLVFKNRDTISPSVKWRIPWLYLLTAVMLSVGAAYFLLQEYRDFKMKRALIPPTEFGQALTPDPDGRQSLVQMLRGRIGFLVWSSNRSGNHDLWMQTLPNGTPQQLTSHPHAEYYPRISPDGRQVIFARSKQVWTAHRDFWGWDTFLLDLATGEEKELARDAAVPTWSADGEKIYFQRYGRQVVEMELASGAEKVVLESGKNVDIPADTWIGWPYMSPDDDKIAVTLSGAVRKTAVIERNGGMQLTGDGCQLAWAPDGSYLFKVDHGGKQMNALYTLDPASLAMEKWFDYPGEFSHEYFPRVANTGDFLVYGASSGDHEHDKADYEIFLWQIGQPAESALRMTFHSGNDNWPDIYLK